MTYWAPSNGYLQHFGILGMKWGVRRYQNPDGSLTAAGKQRYGLNVDRVNKLGNKGNRDASLNESYTLPKGTNIYRVTVNDNEETSGLKYVSFTDVDRNHYQGGWVRNMADADTAYENTYILKEDLKVPSRKETYSVVNDVLSKNEKSLQKTAESYFDIRYPKGTMDEVEFFQNAESEREKKQYVKDYVNDRIKEYKNMSSDQAAFWCMQTFGVNNGIRDAVIKELKSRGYNAVTDEASVGGQNGFTREGIAPLIIFDSNASLSKISTNEISRKEEDKASTNYYRKFYNKANYDNRLQRKTGNW